MNKENVLITGSDGMVGSYFNYGIRLGKQELDVTDVHAVLAACREHKPEAIVHLAAYNDLATAETDPTNAYVVNAAGTYHLALAAREIDAKLVYVSTSGVFDGTKKDPYIESDTPNPINNYGHSKYLGELAVLKMLENFIIARTSWVFGGGPEKDKKFVGKLLRERPSNIRAVTDRRGSPTYAKDLVDAITRLIQEDFKGITHLCGGEATRFDVAKEVVSLAGISAELVLAKAAEFAGAYQSGENESMVRHSYMRSWEEGLAEYVRAEWGID